MGQVSNCRTGCLTQDHRSYGECLRDAGVGVNLRVTPRNTWDRDLHAYRTARDEGLQPDSTNRQDVEIAKAFSDKTGVAYDAGDKTGTFLKVEGLG